MATATRISVKNGIEIIHLRRNRKKQPITRQTVVIFRNSRIFFVKRGRNCEDVRRFFESTEKICAVLDIAQIPRDNANWLSVVNVRYSKKQPPKIQSFT